MQRVEGDIKGGCCVRRSGLGVACGVVYLEDRRSVVRILGADPDCSLYQRRMHVQQLSPCRRVKKKKREEKNKRIWDLREKRHKGVEKGDKAFLESLYYDRQRKE